ncbi:glycine cleavage system protein H [Thermodesulfobacteriota bacterium]
MSKDNLRCVWMQANVVRQKLCSSGFNCTECRFDRVMSHIADENKQLINQSHVPGGRRGKIISWRDSLRSLPPSKRPCAHHMKGRIEFRLCNNDYHCRNCDFDQYFQDEFTVHTVMKPVSVLDMKGFKVPQGYYFHRGHTWVKIEEGSSVRVGIDDFALRLLGPLDRIEAPLMGKEVRQDHQGITLFRGEKKAKVLSPVSGVVTSINVKLRERGTQANEDPFADGWVMRVHTENLRSDFKNLMINHESMDFMKGQVDQLYRNIEATAGPLAADGGFLGQDIYGNMPQLGWKRLAKEFLHT